MASITTHLRASIEALAPALKTVTRFTQPSGARCLLNNQSLQQIVSNAPANLAALRNLSTSSGTTASTPLGAGRVTGVLGTLSTAALRTGGNPTLASASIRHFQTGPGKWPQTVETKNNPHAPELSTRGREMPDITPQSLGRAIAPGGIVGEWSGHRVSLVKTFEKNLALLSQVEPQQVEQLRSELTLHWHAMSEVEKVEVLDLMANRDASADLPGRCGLEAPRVHNWLAERLKVTPADSLSRLQEAVAPTAKQAMTSALSKGSLVQPYFNNLAAERLYPYANHLEVYGGIGELPPEAGRKTVGIVGGGPSGLLAAYELLKAGCDVEVIEASGRIGGRLAATELSGPLAAGEKAAIGEMGGMRFPAGQELYKHYAVEQAAHGSVPSMPTPPWAAEARGAQ